jgi:hypothetical protein
LVQHTKTGKNIPNNPKYNKWSQNILNGRKIDQMSIKYTNIFHCMTVQNLPNWDFWFENLPAGNPALNSDVLCYADEDNYYIKERVIKVCEG